MKVSIIVLTGLAAAACLRGRSAALRHWVIAAAMVCAGVMPAFVPFLPPSPLHWDSAPIPSGSARPGGIETSISVASPPRDTARGTIPSHFGGPGTTALWLSGIWILGAGLSLGILGLGLARIARLTSAGRPADARWRRALAEIAHDQNVGRVRLVESSHPAILATWGVIRPTIMVPAGASAWPDDLVRVVLHHELAHIRRGDWLIQIAGELLRSAYWFNPLVWIACARLRTESEQACDDEVLRRGIEPPAYADHLVSLARTLRPGHAWLPAPAMARPSTLHRRVTAMLNTRVDRSPLSRRARVATLTLLLAATAAIAAPQSFTTFSGSLTDPQGGLMPGARVTLTNAARQTKYEVLTTSTGEFEVPGLPAGDYAVEVQVPGFQTYRADVTMQGAAVRRDIMLALGTVREMINVDDSAISAAPSPRAATPPNPACESGPANGAIRVGGNIRAPRKLRDVRPIYPASLKGTGAEAEVVLDAVIGVDGVVKDMHPRNGAPPAFAEALMTAVAQWEFDSTVLNCVRVEVPITITGHFGPQR